MMNTTALAIAGVGLLGAFLSLKLDRYAKNIYVGLILQVGGVALSFLLMAILAETDQTMYDAGSYFGQGFIVMLIVRFLYARRKSRRKPDSADSVE